MRLGRRSRNTSGRPELPVSRESVLPENSDERDALTSAVLTGEEDEDFEFVNTSFAVPSRLLDAFATLIRTGSASEEDVHGCLVVLSGAISLVQAYPDEYPGLFALEDGEGAPETQDPFAEVQQRLLMPSQDPAGEVREVLPSHVIRGIRRSMGRLLGPAMRPGSRSQSLLDSLNELHARLEAEPLLQVLPNAGTTEESRQALERSLSGIMGLPVSFDRPAWARPLEETQLSFPINTEGGSEE